MTKDFCDMCQKDITGLADYVRVSAIRFSDYRVYCTACFLAKKNWKTIHTLTDKVRANSIAQEMNRRVSRQSAS